MPFDPTRDPHRRRNPLTGDWVIVSPQRTRRPWDGRSDDADAVATDPYDPGCHLCPGNHRATGARNPDYDSTHVFVNDFAALLPDVPSPPIASARPISDAHGSAAHGWDGRDADGGDLFEIEPAPGECRVVCFSPRHDLTLANMDSGDVRTVVELWRSELAELLGTYECVQIFETRGALSGASNSHPHGQIWASQFLPNEAVAELRRQRSHRERHGCSLLVDYAQRELAFGERVVVENEHWLVVVPYWAYWPFETLVVPRRPVASLVDLHEDECASLAAILPTMLRGFDRLFDTPFPYCSGWHSAPRGVGVADGWQLHAHYYPPLLRSADVAKIPASYELLANAQRDLTAEDAARRLRAVT